MKKLTLGQRIKSLREKKGLNQKELAEILKVNNSTLSQYENDVRVPSDDIKLLLANYFNVTTDYLLGRSDTPNPDTPTEKIKSAVSSDPELAEFWEELSEREDLQLMFKQVKDLSPQSIRRIVKVIKAIEDEESGE